MFFFKEPTTIVEWFTSSCTGSNWIKGSFGPRVTPRRAHQRVRVKSPRLFETDGPNFETERLMRLTVIDWEKVDDWQLAQLVTADFENSFTASFAILSWENHKSVKPMKF